MAGAALGKGKAVSQARVFHALRQSPVAEEQNHPPCFLARPVQEEGSQNVESSCISGCVDPEARDANTTGGAIGILDRRRDTPKQNALLQRI